MSIWEFIKLRVASDFTIALVLIAVCFLLYALIVIVKCMRIFFRKVSRPQRNRRNN